MIVSRVNNRKAIELGGESHVVVHNAARKLPLFDP